MARLHHFDILKGMAIYMVVMGHVLTMCVRGIDASLIFKLIGEVHMPLFFFISGWLAYRTDTNGRGIPPVLGKRSLRLLVPMVAVSALWVYVLPSKGLDSPLPATLTALWTDQWKGGYWFTLVLMEIFVLYRLMFRPFASARPAAMEIVQILGAWVLLIMVNNWLTPLVDDIFSWVLVVKFFPVFMMGVVARRHSTVWDRLCSTSWAVTAATVLFTVSFAVVGWAWQYPENMDIVATPVMHLSLVVIAMAAVRPWSDAAVAAGSRAAAMWTYLGKRSLAIYLLHYFFLFPMGWARPWLMDTDMSLVPMGVFAALWAAAIVAAVLLLDRIIAPSRLLSFLLTGDNIKLEKNQTK